MVGWSVGSHPRVVVRSMAQECVVPTCDLGDHDWSTSFVAAYESPFQSCVCWYCLPPPSHALVRARLLVCLFMCSPTRHCSFSFSVCLLVMCLCVNVSCSLLSSCVTTTTTDCGVVKQQQNVTRMVFCFVVASPSSRSFVSRTTDPSYSSRLAGCLVGIA